MLRISPKHSVVLLLLLWSAGCVDAGATFAGRDPVKTGVLSQTLQKDVFWEEVFPQDTGAADSADLFDVEDFTDLGEDGTLDLDVGEDGDTIGDVCTPQCDEKECGPDECGSYCGYCPTNKPLCSFGHCVACDPVCAGAECGSDGCGGSCGTCPSLFSCVDGLCQPPACQGSTTYFEESFDSCGQGAFDIVDFNPTDGVTWWGLPGDVYSLPCALYMGDVSTLSYDTGARVNLDLVSPEIEVPVGPMIQLRFMIRLDLEPAPAPEYPYDYDVLVLYADVPEPDGGVSSVELFNSKMLLNNTGSSFEPVRIGLLSLAGKTVRFRFSFDTVDSTDNGYNGVHLDDFALESVCPLCSGDNQCDDSDPCTSDRCVFLANDPTMGSCYNDELYGCCLGAEEGFCDDGDPCTLDSCNFELKLCVHQPLQTPECLAF